MLVTIKKFRDHNWAIINANERGYSDVLFLHKLAGMGDHPKINFRTKKAARAHLDHLAKLAADRGHGFYEFI